jgi:hypothetical protein
LVSPAEAKKLLQAIDLPFCLFKMFGEGLLKFLVFCSFGEFRKSLYQLILGTVEVSKFFEHYLP